MIINRLAREDSHRILGQRSSRLASYFDTTGDGYISVLDALRVINHLGDNPIYDYSDSNAIGDTAPAGFTSVAFLTLPGTADQLVDVVTTIDPGEHALNELGFFRVDSESGEIEGVWPTDDEYPNKVFATEERHVVYSMFRSKALDSAATFEGGSRIGVYALQATDDTRVQGERLSVKHSDTAGDGALSLEVDWRRRLSALSAEVTAYVDVTDPYTSESPTIIQPLPDQQTSEKQVYEYDVSTHGVDGLDEIVFSLDTAPPGMVIDAEKGALSWIPPESAGPETHLVTVRVANAEGVVDTSSFELTVEEIHEPPVFAPVQPQHVLETQTLAFGLDAFDPDLPADSLTYSLVSGPAGATINAETGEFSWRPELGEGPGDYTVVARVSDGRYYAEQLMHISAGRCVFPDGLPGFSVSEFGGKTEPGSATTSNCSLVLSEGDSFRVEVSQEISVPIEPSEFRVRYEQEDFDFASLGTIKDAFEISLTDAEGRSLLHTIPGQTDASFNRTEGLPETAGGNVSWSEGTVLIDLSHLPAGTPATLNFRLLNNDSDKASSITITDAQIVPLTINSPVGVAKPFEIRGVTDRIELSELSVVDSLTVNYGVTSFHEQETILTADVAVENVGEHGVSGPIVVVLDQISSVDVQAIDFDGITADGNPYFLADLVSSIGRFEPGSQTPPFQLAFSNPNQIQFLYDVTILARLNQAPELISAPVTEAINDKVYSYQALATDDDEDPLHYHLDIAPAGMSIDESSGLISWIPQSSQIGSHRIALTVDDRRGGTDTQHFSVHARDAVPNRPPLFQSNPVVSAYVNHPYEYSAIAIDPDQDPMAFLLTQGPASLGISNAGELSWIPSDDQLGKHSVTIQVVDGRGGSAEQTFDILVQSEPGNAAPQFLSIPPTEYDYRGSTNSVIGDVSPSGLELNLAPGALKTETVSLKLGPSIPKADVFLLADDTGSFSSIWPSLSEFFPQLVDDLETALPATDLGIGLGRFDHYGRHHDDGTWPQTPFTLNLPILATGTENFDAIVNEALARSIASGGTQDASASYIEALHQAATGIGFDGDGDGSTTGSGPAGSLFNQVLVGSNGDVPAFSSYGDPYDAVFPFRFVEPSTIDVDEFVAGTLGPEFGLQAFQFEAKKGQRLKFEGLNRGVIDSRWPGVNLYGPDGILVRSPLEHLADGIEVTIPSSGSHVLELFHGRISAVGGPLPTWGFFSSPDPIDFSFTFRDLSPAPIPASGFGASHSGTLSPDEVREFEFQAPYGLPILIDDIVSDSGVEFRFDDPSGQETIDWRDLTDWSVITTAANGAHKVSIRNTSSDVASFEFRVLNLRDSQTIQLGTDFEVNLQPEDGIKFFQFDSGSGEVFFDRLGSLPNGFRSNTSIIYDRNGVRVTSANPPDDQAWSLQPNQTYYLAVTNTPFRLNTDPAFTARLIDADTTATGVAFDTSVDAALQQDRTELFRFDGVAGQRIRFDDLGSTSSGNWKIFSLNQSEEGGLGVDSPPVTLEFDEPYLLAVSSDQATGSSSAKFQLQTLRTFTEHIEVGMRVSGTVARDGDIHRFTFSPEVGKRLFVENLNGSTSSLRLTTPSKKQVTLSTVPYLVRECGEYVLEHRSSSAYDFRVVDLDSVAVPLVSGQLVSGQSVDREVPVFTFSGSVGDTVSIEFPQRDGYNRAFVFAPDGSLVTSGFSFADFRLHKTGDYTLLLIPSSDATLDYQLRMTIVPTVGSPKAGLNELFAGTLAPSEVLDIPFSAPAGMPIYVDNQSSGNTSLRLLFDDGAGAGFSADQFYVLRESGDYLIRLTNSSTTLNQDYRLRILDLSETPLISGRVQDEFSDGVSSTKAYRLQTTPGQRVFLEPLGVSQSGSQSRISILGPNGKEFLRNDSLHLSRLPITLEQGGDHYVLLTSSSVQSDLSFDFQIRQLNSALVPSLQPDTRTQVSIAAAGASQLFFVDGDAGDRWFFDQLDGPDLRPRLYGIDDSIFSGTIGDGLTSPSSGHGPYLLVIPPDSASAIESDFQFRPVTLTHQSADLNTVNRLEFNGDPTIATYSFNGVSGQRILYDALDSFINVTPPPQYADFHAISLIEPSGTEIPLRTNIISNRPPNFADSDRRPVVLDQTGQYQFTIHNIDFPDNDSFSPPALQGHRGGAGFRTDAVPIILLATDTKPIFRDDGVDPVVGDDGVEVSMTQFPGSAYRTPGDRGASIQETIDALNQMGAIVVGLGTSTLGSPRTQLEGISTLTASVNNSAEAVESGITGDPIEPGEPLYFLINGGNLSGEIGASLTATLKAAIESAATVSSFDITVIPSDPTALVENLTGVINNVAAGETATFDIRFTGEERPSSFDLLFVQESSGVVLGSIPVDANPPAYLYPSVAVDPDGDAIQYRLLSGPAGADVSETGVIEWQPSEEGLFEFVLEAFDGRGGASTQSFTVIVGQEENAIPVIHSAAPLNAAINVPWEYRVGASDNDDDLLQYFLTQAPAGMRIDTLSGVVSWRPSEAQLGDQDVTIRVIDGRGGEELQSFTVGVGSDRTNDSPTITSQPVTSASVDVVLRHQVTATDPDIDPLRFDLPLRPAGMTIRPDDGRIVWEPIADQVGIHDVVVRVRDNRGGVDLQAFQIEVAVPNTPPELISSPPLSATIGTPYEYSVFAQDADQDALLFSLAANPIGMTINPSSGIIRWTPAADQLGSQPVTIEVIDGTDSRTQSYSVDVSATGINEPPEFRSMPPSGVQLGQDYRYRVDTFDSNGDPLQLSLIGGPAGMTLEGQWLLWKPSGLQLGTHAVSLGLSDGRGGEAIQSFDVNVTDRRANTAPRITSEPQGTATVGVVYAYDLKAEDDQADIVIWSLVDAPSGVSLDPVLGTLRWTPTKDQVGDAKIAVRANDAQGGATEQRFLVRVQPLNLPPLIRSVPPTTGAVEQQYEYPVDAIDPEGGAIAFSLENAPAGMSIDAAGLITWLPNDTQKGAQSFRVVVNDDFGAVAGQAITIVIADQTINQPPTITSVPSPYATLGEEYTYRLISSDPEGDNITTTLDDPPAGMTFESATGLVRWTPTMAQVGTNIVQITVADALSPFTTTQRFTIEVAANNPPVIESAAKATATVGDLYAYDVIATDPERDPRTYELTSGPIGMTMDDQGRIRWLPSETDIGTHQVLLKVSDTRGAFDTQGFDLQVLADTTPPQLTLVLEPNPAVLGSTVDVRVVAVDDVAVSATTLSVDGVFVPLDLTGRATLDADNLGTRSLVASATDPSGNQSNTSKELVINDPHVVGDPVVQITSPLASIDPATGRITAPTDVLGTAADPDLSFYTLAIAPLDGGDFVEIARGTQSVNDGVLGRIDPTLLPNGEYFLRLHAIDTGGNESETQTVISVVGDLKVGNFTLSFTDVSVPVSGIPVVVGRTYDSLNASRDGELGFGWQLDLRQVDLRDSVPETGLEDQLIYNPYFSGVRVFVSIPGEGRDAFTFAPRLAAGPRGSILGIWEPHFEPDPGVMSTLQVDPVEIRLTAGGTFALFDGTPYNPANPAIDGEFLIRTKNGIEYTVSGDTGNTETVADRNGNELVFNDLGVTSSTGVGVLFERDIRGRITGVIDPMGNRVEYEYDSAGNMTAVKDREGNTTRFRYLNDPEHYLEEIIDPLGRTGIRSEYDGDGRLIRMIDAAGEAVQLVHDIENFTETVVDQLGNPTVYQYDALGNVTTEIDAEGGVTRSVYADPNNPTLETEITKVLADGTELTTSYEYDGRGNVLVETDPRGTEIRTTYNRFNDPLDIVDPLGHVTKNNYDGVGNLTSIVDPDGTTSSFEFDANGNPTSLTIGANRTTFQYDSSGRVTRQTDAAGVARTFTHDANGNQLTETVRFTTSTGSSTVLSENSYDAEGREVSSVVKQDGVILSQTTHRYDANGNRVETVDGLGNSTLFVYDDRGQLVETILPDETPGTNDDNPRTRTLYDEAGRVTEEIDQLGRSTRSVYDRAGRNTKTIFPAVTAADPNDTDPSDNPFRETLYDRAGRTIAEIDERGNRLEFQLDLAGNVITTILPDETPGNANDNPRVVDEYDAAGRRTSTTDPLGNQTFFVYSDSGLLAETLLPDNTPNDESDNPRTRNLFDDNRQLVARVDAAGIRTEYEYDDLGRLTAVVQFVTDPSTSNLKELRTEYAYNELGNLVRQTDANDHTTRYEYDGAGRRIGTVLPLGQASASTYDRNGNLVRTVDFNGDTITYQYDAQNRLTEKDYPGTRTTKFTYLQNGQPETIEDHRGITRFRYDERDRLLSRTDPDGSNISYTYDDSGNRTSVTTTVFGNAPRTTVYSFDVQGRMETVTDPEGGVTTYGYDQAGRQISMEYPNSTREIRQYDEQNRLLLIEHRNTTSDTVFASFAYELDEAGNRTAVTEHDGRRVEYEYDELYRLLAENIFDPGSSTATRTIDYVYDDVGNRLSRNDSAEGLTTYVYDANDQLLRETLGTDVTTYRYDDNGNSIAKAINNIDQVLYHWDEDNRLIAADTNADGTNDVAYEYDTEGIRVSKTLDPEGTPDETRFLIDANRPYQQVLEEYTPGGVIKESYSYGEDLLKRIRHEDSNREFYHVDGVGSTRVLSDSLANATVRYTYDSFGQILEQIGDSSNIFLFAGEQRDSETGLAYLRARYINRTDARFASRDTFSGSLSNPITLHRYVYANANPLRYVDPTGLFSMLSLSASLAINTSIQDIQFSFAQAGAKAVVKSAVISGMLIGPAKTVQLAGLLMMSAGKPRGFDLYSIGRHFVREGFRQIHSSIKQIYSDLRSDIVSVESLEIEIKVGQFEVEFEIEDGDYEFEFETPWFEIETKIPRKVLEVAQFLDEAREFAKTFSAFRNELSETLTEIKT
ncbi:MAG: hypothetical protein F9B45_19665 [Phycisphaera sp. RhM]|nr:hypothetical protein [Phycisphaera sp. RhM]